MKTIRNLMIPKTTGVRLIVALIAICVIASVFTSTAQMQGKLSKESTSVEALPAQEIAVEAKPGRAEQPARALIGDTITDLKDSAGAPELFASPGNNSPVVAGTCETAGPIEVESSGGTAAGVSTPYATLALAFTAINGGVLHTGTITIDVCGNTTETTTAALNQVAGVTSVAIAPAGGAARTISGAIAAGSPLIDLNGADNVTINGLNTGGNSLTISNTTIGTTVGSSTIRFIADATNNTVTNCSILGSSASTLATVAGTIVFATGTTTGNDTNTISNNNIGPAGANLPSKAIMASGTSSAIENDNVQITGNNIFDYFLATGSHSGINIITGNEAWTISNNKFYQTAARTVTTAASRHSAITLNNSTGGFTVSGNTIGFSAANGTGTYTITGTSNEFRAIDAASVRTTAPATTIQNNTISGINQTSSRASTTTANSAFIAVAMGTTDGLINATGNTIGSLDGSSTIVLNLTSTTASTAPVIGFYNFSFFATDISSNNIGAMTINSGGTGTTVGFRGILVNTTTGVAATINSNTIGGTNAAGAITDTQVGSYSMYGIQTSLPNLTATGNTIRNMSSASNGAALIISSGLLASGSTGANTISQNTIHSLSNASGAAANSIYGMSLSLPATANVIERNFIHSFSLTSTVTGTQIWGISGGATGTATYKNNIIRLGINAAGNSVTLPTSMIGMRDAAGSTNQFYHNSIYIGGTGVLATPTPSNSYCFFSDVVTVTRAYQDNIFWNARSNAVAGGVAHIAIRVGGTAANPAGLTSNYNDLYFSGNDGATGVFNAVVIPTLAAWRTATGQDANSFAGDPNFIAPNGTSSTVDLHVQSNTPIESHGLAIPAVTDDFDGQTRSALTPTDIGADAGNFVSSVIQFNSATYSVNENDGTGLATITLSRTQTVGAVSVTASTVAGGTATPGDDYTTTSTSVTFADGAATATFTIPINNDAIYEGNETVFLALSGPTSGAALGAQSTAVLTIVDDDAVPVFSIDDVTHTEGDSGTTSYTFTITKTGTTALGAAVDFTTVDGTATVADNDYTANSGTLNFSSGDTTKQVTVLVNGDTTFEADETFTVHLSNASGATIADADGTGTITNDDPQNTGTFQFSAANYSVNESRASATITVTRTGSTSGAATIHYETSDGTANAGSDYTTASGDLNFANGETSRTFTVSIINDTDTEPDETVTLTLSNPSAGASLGTPNPATLTIVDNDGAASSNIVVVLPTDLHGWAAFSENTASATFVNGPATPPYGSGSYQMSTGAGDGAGQGGKSYFKTNTYNGTRLDAISSMSYSTYVDPSTPGDNIASVIEMMVDTDGNGTRNTTLVFEPIYSPEQGAIQKGVWQTWNARTGRWRSSATVGPIVPNTYFPLDTFIDTFPDSKIVEWFPRADGFGLGTSVGQSSGGTWANFVGHVDGFEIGTNNASTINDYELALPAISVDDPTFVEGDALVGPHFTVTLSGASSVPVMVDYATADGTATAGSDYQSTNGTLTFAPNETSKDVPITIIGDMVDEGAENFFLNLTNPVNATINDAQGIGTITDDDDVPSFSIDDVTHMEGNSGTTVYTFTVTKTGATTFPTAVDFTTVDGTATVANNDYVSNNGTLNFAPADTTKEITVNVNGDPFVEPDEAFTVHLSNESGATIADADGTGTITNDDSAPAVVYVDDDFTGPVGSDPDGAGPATAIGYDAFPTIQGGVDGVAPNGTVNVAAGTYHEDVNVNKTLTLNGAGAGVVTISGAIGGPSATTVQVTASNVQIGGFTITRDGNNPTDWNNPGLNLAGIAIQGQAISGTLVHDNIITGNRTGLDINNTNGHTIRNNVVDFNRTGFIFRNQTDYQTVVENFITNNWTVGILFLDASSGSNVPVQSAAHSTFSNNDLSANWYGQIVDRQSGGALPAPGTSNLKNFRGNWFGTTSPVVTTANSAEPGYAAQIPVEYGGSATPPGGQPDIAGPASANFKYIPFLLSGTDTNIETTPGRGTFGFQGVPNTVVVSPVNLNGWAFFDDNPGVGTGSGGFEDGPATPPLGVGSAFLTVDATGRRALGTATYAGTRMDDVTDLRYSSYQDNNSNTVVAPSLQFDIDYDLKDTFTNYQGRLVFEPYQSGTVQQNVWQNWNALAGNWYGTRSTVTINGNVSVPNPCQQNTPCTWQQVLASFPNAGLLNAGALLFKVGGPWSPGFEGNVDAFNISVNAAHVVYDFEPLPHLSIDDVTHLEGNSSTTAYTFTVTLSRAFDQTVTVDYATEDVTATAPSDYTALPVTQLIFNPGETSKQVVVQVNGDTAVEPDETFNVKLSNPSNATITDDTGVGTIQNDDVAPTGILAFSSATYNVNENDPAQHATITVTRTGGTNGTVTVDYTTSDGTATAGADYTTASGTLTFADGVTSQSFDVPVINDNVYEGNETVNLALSNPQGGSSALGSQSTAVLTIVDNEAPPAVSVNNVTVNEGNSGTVDLVFTVSLSAPSASPVSVHYDTADSTAHAPVDYQSASGDVNIPANALSATITVTASGDAGIEGNETFFVNLSSPVGATIADGQGVGTLDNDDGPTGRRVFTKFDFDGDSQTDLAVWDGSNGNWHVLNSQTLVETIRHNWGLGVLGDVIVPADYDGDGRIDYAVFRSSEGNWYIIQSTTDTVRRVNWGGPGDRPVPGDYDGDNLADVAVWREAEGNWYVLNSRDNTSTVHGWGAPGDQPAQGDFDGDRMTDLAVYRPSEGNWYIINSSLNTVTLQNWGITGDRIAPGDYDGDGLTDLAVYRGAGNWYIRKSTGGSSVRNWGNSDDKLVPGDYDGDGLTDIAIFRPSEGTWYIIQSQTDTGRNYYLGRSDDVLIPGAYIEP